MAKTKTPNKAMVRAPGRARGRPAVQIHKAAMQRAIWLAEGYKSWDTQAAMFEKAAALYYRDRSPAVAPLSTRLFRARAHSLGLKWKTRGLPGRKAV